MRLLYTGPSLLDGAPIFVAAVPDSTNRKTGPMTQIYIMRADVHPLHAVRTGEDASVCGDCALRGVAGKDRACYVTVQHAPAAVYRAFREGKYEDYRAQLGSRLSPGQALSGQLVRVGAYGDPAAVHHFEWRKWLFGVRGWTAYTHQWRRCPRAMRRYCMASVDSEEERREARAAGWRTFRVRGPLSDLQPGEIVCPASDEAGHRSTCARCRLCNGTRVSDEMDHRRKDIAILAHRTPGVFARQAQGALPFP